MTTITRIITKENSIYEATIERQTVQQWQLGQRCCRNFDNTAGHGEREHKENCRTDANLVYTTFRVLPNDTTASATDERN